MNGYLRVLLYRFLISLFSAISLAKGPVRARLGRDTQPIPAGPHVWLHGASNGELASFRPIFEKLVEDLPNINWLVTSNTETGRDMVASWALDRVSTRLAPLDLSWVTLRVIRRWNVQAHITLESEIWPHRILHCRGPVLILGARMSAGTAKSWRKLGRLPARVLGKVSLALAQDEASQTRLLELGLSTQASGPVMDLKSLYSAPNLTPDPQLIAAFSRSQTWLAASTHEGDEEVVLAAHDLALRDRPDTKLILAPRHPRRAQEIADMIRARGFSTARRSTGEPPNKDGRQICLADTMGEMALWYQLAGRVFIGGSLSDRGGHTPYEPATFASAILHGPDMRNFAAASQRLQNNNAAIQIETAHDLGQALLCLAPEDKQIAAGQAAKDALKSDLNLDELCQTIAKIICAPTE
ncbi:glycosyltransferase N-terminal domain-containing protein [Tropicibacter sp. R15_0]|uniref:3-deoxy-D-manno-octulosonic acid transferase n=1 Tax=Tropicibacter sp. R15_0 TaxID=2821101 RepID=UPI0025700ACD|nr:glycosyltransferase N-terminal domain-containing protein [Tropicibacter sp. R15_0]